MEKFLKDWGQRVNYSVFECEIKNAYFPDFIKKATELIHNKHDRIIFYRLCKACYGLRVHKGWGGPVLLGDYLSI